MSHQEEQRPLVDFTIRFRRYEEQREYVNDEIVAEISIRAVSQEEAKNVGEAILANIHNPWRTHYSTTAVEAKQGPTHEQQ